MKVVRIKNAKVHAGLCWVREKDRALLKRGREWDFKQKKKKKATILFLNCLIGVKIFLKMVQWQGLRGGPGVTDHEREDREMSW